MSIKREECPACNTTQVEIDEIWETMGIDLIGIIPCTCGEELWLQPEPPKSIANQLSLVSYMFIV